MSSVLTIDLRQLAAICRELQRRCEEYNPDLIVGIGRGGSVPAGLIFPEIGHVELSVAKSGLARLKGKWLSALPSGLLDRLRTVELLLKKNLSKRPCIELPEESVSAVQCAKRILLVDDAVDTGQTLKSATAVLHDCAPEARIRSAVLTITLPCPHLLPDYCYFPQGTKLRMPWSKDAAR